MPAASRPFFVVDAFTDRAFTGNPGAVFLLDEPADPAWMAAVAREMNVSATAFAHPAGGDRDLLQLRWFTPSVEIPLCGHGTLVTAHVLWETGRLPPSGEAHFSTRSGPLGARRDGAFIELDLPAIAVAACAPPPGLAAALGAGMRWVGRSQQDHLLIELDSAAAVRDLRPDFAALKDLPARGFIVTAPADRPPHDVVSRYFAPSAGIDEDPVTGSAHCVLGPFWAGRLGRSDLLAHQASTRGGTLRLGARGGRVLVGGQALTMSRGELVGPAASGALSAQD